MIERPFTRSLIIVCAYLSSGVMEAYDAARRSEVQLDKVGYSIYYSHLTVLYAIYLPQRYLILT